MPRRQHPGVAAAGSMADYMHRFESEVLDDRVEVIGDFIDGRFRPRPGAAFAAAGIDGEGAIATRCEALHDLFEVCRATREPGD